MRRPFALAFALATVAGLAVADAPKAVLSVPASVAEGSVVVLDADGSVSDKPIKWKLTDRSGHAVAGVRLVVTTPDGGMPKSLALIFSAPPGDYQVTILALGTPNAGETGAGQLDGDSAVGLFTVTPRVTPTPPPGPPAPPTPDPPTPPTPDPSLRQITGPVHVWLVFDADHLTQAEVPLWNSPRIRKACADLGYSYHRAASATDTDLVNLNLTPYLPAKLPALLITDQNGVHVLGGKGTSVTSERDVLGRLGTLFRIDLR